VGLTTRARKIRAAAIGLGLGLTFGVGVFASSVGGFLRGSANRWEPYRQQEARYEWGTLLVDSGAVLIWAASLVFALLLVAAAARLGWTLSRAVRKESLGGRFEDLPPKSDPADWRARHLRTRERQLLFAHMKQIEEELRPEEQVHGYSLAFLKNHPIIVLLTQRRLILFRPLLFGLDVCVDLSLALGSMGRIQSKAPSVVKDIFGSRSGLGRTGLVQIERFGGRALTLRVPTPDDAQALAEEISVLNGRGQAGVGALAVAEDVEGGELSHLSEQGALSRGDDL